MTTEILTTSYENGQRICTQKLTYNKSDDVQTLGQNQLRLAQILKRIESAAPGEDLTAITAERNRVTQEIADAQAIINGYGDA